MLFRSDMRHFLTFYAELGKNLVPYRSEWMIFDEELKLAGSIDFITSNDDGSISLYDWKRSKEIKRDNPWQSGLSPVNHLPDTNYWHYCLQLNLYKALIEKNYDKLVKSMALVVMYPNNDSYIVIDVPDLQDEIKALFKQRLKVINNVSNDADDSGSECDTESETGPGFTTDLATVCLI